MKGAGPEGGAGGHVTAGPLEPRGAVRQCVRPQRDMEHEPRGGMVKSVSAYADLQQPDRKSDPVSVYVPPPDYEPHSDDVIKPRKLINPVKESKSHQQLHRELLTTCRRSGDTVEVKPELQRVLESRRREQRLSLRRQEEEAHRKLSPLEQELKRRHHLLQQLEEQEQRQKLESSRAPEFIKVKENLRRTSRDLNQDQSRD